MNHQDSNNQTDPRIPSPMEPPGLRLDRQHATDELWDISPRVSVGSTQVWPGDTPLSREIVCRREEGAPVTLSAIRTTVHLASHADGENHYAVNAESPRSIADLSLRHYLGPCFVFDVQQRIRDAAASQPNTPTLIELADLIPNPSSVTNLPRRVLIRTGTFPTFDTWNPHFAALSPDLVHALAKLGVITIAVDTPSVDPQNSKDLQAHRAIFAHRIAIIEGVNLRAVSDQGRSIEPGVYELIALPLKLEGFDASPLRAILRRPH